MMNKKRIYAILALLLLVLVPFVLATKITVLTELAVSNIVSGDLFPVVDVSDTTMASTGTTKKYSWASLLVDLPAGIAEGAYADSSVVSADIKDDTIDSADYAPLSIDAEHLAADIIDETKIADNGIDSEHYNDDSIDNAHINWAEAALVDSIEALGLTITANWVNTANPWADNEVANILTLDELILSELTSAPGTPAAKKIYLADPDNWDPAGIGGSVSYWCLYDGANWKILFDEDGTWYAASIELPTLEEDEWNDEAGDRLLTVQELKNKILSNSGLGAATHFDFPAKTEGWNFIVICEAVQNIGLDPNGTEQWYMDGTQFANGDEIRNTACTIGESVVCYSTEDAVYCETKYSDWAAVTP